MGSKVPHTNLQCTGRPSGVPNPSRRQIHVFKFQLFRAITLLRILWVDWLEV